MTEKGFAIRCPNCRMWNIWSNGHPEEIALESGEELAQILKELELASNRGEPDSFSHPKLLRCDNPRWVCPASFEGFVCRTEEDSFKFLQTVKAWSFKRDFRLYKTDCKTRWEGKYYGILFNTQPIPWQPNIELESLLKRKLLSRLIVGMSVEIEAPLTVFAANIFAPKGKGKHIYWMPIEAYSSKEQVLIPPRFNIFCRTCRGIVMKKIEDQFTRENVSVSNCPLGFGSKDMCAGIKAACTTKDWNHCPAFIEQRKKCPCYKSDTELISQIQKKWRCGKSMDKGVPHRCKAGLLEVAFPIVVHDHLVGIIMTGQVFFKPSEIVDVKDFVSRWDVLRGSENELEEAKKALIKNAQEPREGSGATFLINEFELNRRIELLRQNIVQMEEMAQSRYRDFRGKSESAFRQEVLGRIQISKMKDNFFRSNLLSILERMLKFWSFRGVYLSVYSFKTRKLSVVAFVNERKKKVSGIPGEEIAEVSIAHRQEHPCPFIYVRGQKPPRDSRLVSLLPIMERTIDASGQHVPEGGRICGTLIPFSDEVYTFVFAVRDESRVSILERRVPGGISDLCQDAILETCTQAIYEFGDARSFVELGERASQAEQIAANADQIAVLNVVAAQFAHRLANVGGTIPLVVDEIEGRLKSAGVKDEAIMQRLRDLRGDTQRLLEMADSLKLSDIGNLVPVDLGAVVEEAIAGSGLDKIRRGIEVNKEIFSELKRVRAVRALLVDIVVNLLQNAAEGNANSISISTFEKPEDKMIDLIVKDNGDGISEKDLGRLFTPFFSTKKGNRVGKLRGLGLWVALHQIRQMGGRISVESRSGKGSKFCLSLRTSDR